jgi:hypothetical protein
MDFEDDDKLGIELADLYTRLRNEFGCDHNGMDPNDRTRAPIAMAILAFADAGIANIHNIEVSVREALGLPGPTIIQTPLGFSNPATLAVTINTSPA